MKENKIDKLIELNETHIELLESIGKLISRYEDKHGNFIVAAGIRFFRYQGGKTKEVSWDGVNFSI